jgi:hypothetical protein
MRGLRFGTRDLVTIAVFAALWGAVETTVGSALHVWNVPQAGTVLASIGMGLLVVGRTFVPKRGATILTGVAAMFIKLFSLGGIVINPMLAILMESALAEIGFGILGTRRAGGILAGAMGVSWNIIHPFLTQGLVAGWGIIRVYRWVVEGGSSLIGLPTRYGVLIFAFLLATKPLAGALGGLAGWEVSRVVNRRMGRKPAAALGEAEAGGSQRSGGSI